MLPGQSFCLFNIRPFLLFWQTFPGGSQFFTDHSITHAWVRFKDLTTFFTTPHHKAVHWSTYVTLTFMWRHICRVWCVWYQLLVWIFSNFAKTPSKTTILIPPKRFSQVSLDLLNGNDVRLMSTVPSARLYEFCWVNVPTRTYDSIYIKFTISQGNGLVHHSKKF